MGRSNRDGRCRRGAPAPGSRRTRRALSVAVLVLMPAADVLAADTWTNVSGSRFWSANLNWADGTEPGPTDDVTFPTPVPAPPNSDTVFLSLGEVARSLVFNASYTLVPDAPNATLTMSIGGIQVAGGQTAQIDVPIVGDSGSSVQFNGLGSGKLIMTAANTYTGNTSIAGGTLQLGNGGSTGSVGGNVNLLSTGTLTFNHSTNTVFLGAITGSGAAINKLGANLLAFYGNNTYTGTTTISGGTLQVGDGATGGAIAGNVIVNAGATFAFNRSDNVTYAGAISGDGAFNKMAANTLTLTGNHAYTGGTTIAANGTLQVGAGGTSGWIFGSVVSGSGTIAFNRADNMVFEDLITGSVRITKLGANKLTLTANNTATGVVNINGGTLQLGDGGTAGTVSSNVSINSGTLVFDRSDDLTFAGIISGTGGLTKLGTNTLTLPNDASHTGLTTIAGGTLRVGTGSNNGSLAGNVANEGTLVFDHLSSKTYAGTISGTGAVTKSGNGTLVLTGNHTNTGTTTISPGNGGIQIGAGGTSGSIAGNINNGGFLTFNRSDDVTYAGVISGAGSTTKSGAGTLVLTADQPYTGFTSITQGTLQVGNGGTSGAIAASGGVNVNGTLAFHRSDDVTYAGFISGSGGVTKLGNNTLTYTVDHTYTGVTLVPAGTLRLGAGGFFGVVAGPVTNNGSVVFEHSINKTYSGAISGSGSVTKLGSNLLILTGNNTHTGTTTISDGILRVGNGGTGGALTGNIVNNGLLGFNRSDAVTFAGNISGAGSVEMLNINTLTLSGTQTYTGGTFVSGGGVLNFTKSYPTGSQVSVSNSSTARLAPSAATPNNVVLRTGAVNLTITGSIDLTNNKLIVAGAGDGTAGVGIAFGGNYSGLSGLIQRAHHGGAWDRTGITTSIPAATTGLTSLGIATAGRTGHAGGTFGGVSVAADDALVMYTYAGDSNLDGFISGDDYAAIDFNIAVPGASGWVNGDFNYDGIISGDDYTVIDFNIVAQGAPFPSSGASSATGGGTVAVPEPASLGAILPVIFGCAWTRRRRSRRG